MVGQARAGEVVGACMCRAGERVGGRAGDGFGGGDARGIALRSVAFCGKKGRHFVGRGGRASEKRILLGGSCYQSKLIGKTGIVGLSQRPWAVDNHAGARRGCRLDEEMQPSLAIPKLHSARKASAKRLAALHCAESGRRVEAGRCGAEGVRVRVRVRVLVLCVRLLLRRVAVLPVPSCLFYQVDRSDRDGESTSWFFPLQG